MTRSADRMTVTLVAVSSNRAGLIRNRRGRVVVVDRKGLEDVACDVPNERALPQFKPLRVLGQTGGHVVNQGEDSDGSTATMQPQGQITYPILTALGQLPLAGKSVLIIEDEALISMLVESWLQDAGATIVVANSLALAQSALDEGTPFDVAVVDLLLPDGNASPLIQVLSERGIPVVIATGDQIDHGPHALGKAVAVLQKPYTGNDLISAITALININ